MKKKIGVIVNPIAGMGGKVGLKGSDGEEILRQAIKLGAIPESPVRARAALEKLKEFKDEIEIITYPGDMGEKETKALNLPVTVIGSVKKRQTTPDDTIRAARDMMSLNVDIILFVGGDGTARNIVDAIDGRVPSLGVPAGCKIHSAVYALTPKAGGELVVKYLQNGVKGFREAEVMDIDEEAFRQGVVRSKLYGYLKIPNDRNLVQNMKSGRNLSEEASISLIGNYISDSMEANVLYIIGPGSTTRSIMEKLSLKNTLLGVDLVYNHQVLANDVTEKQILMFMECYSRTKIVVTVIGGQGYIFGRGNQQISANVIKKAGKENTIIIATKDKINKLFGQALLADTGDDETNAYLTGYYKVVVGYGEMIMFKLKA